MDSDFLRDLLVGAYPKPDCSCDDMLCPNHKQTNLIEGEQAFGDLEETALCEYCSEPSDDLVEVETSDPSVGYRSSMWICAKCQRDIRIRKANY